MSVVKIAGDGGRVRRKTWSHVAVRADLTNPTREEVERVRGLVQRIVAVMDRETDPHVRKSASLGHSRRTGVLRSTRRPSR